MPQVNEISWCINSVKLISIVLVSLLVFNSIVPLFRNHSMMDKKHFFKIVL